MIDYLEIRKKDTREIIGIIDTAESIIWTSKYYGVGDFEIYVASNQITSSLLIDGNYVSRPDALECGIIEQIEISSDAEKGKMIVAKGRMIKSILDRRIIFQATRVISNYEYIWSCVATVLNGNVESAIRKLIYDNAINAINERPEAGAYRNIPEIYWTNDDITGLDETIVVDTSATQTESAEKQVTYKNLLDYTESVLQEYQLGSIMWLDRSLLKFRYKVYKGIDKSRDGSSLNPIIFSKEMDNLTSSNYATDSSSSKNTALIGGEGEGEARKCAFAQAWNSGLDRRETFIDASSMAQEGQTITDYRKQLETEGKQQLAKLQKIETFDGTIDLTNANLEYRNDYNVGDIITIEDRDIGVYINARILSVTEVQDENGYTIDAEYGL